jgi:hypothetical protein
MFEACFRPIQNFALYVQLGIAKTQGPHQADPFHPSGAQIVSQRLPTIEGAEINVATHYRHSSLRERIIEHIFVGDALRPRRP